MFINTFESANKDLKSFRDLVEQQLMVLKLKGVECLDDRTLLLSLQLIETAIELIVERELIEDIPPERVKDIRDFAIVRIYESIMVDIQDEIARDVRFAATARQMKELTAGLLRRYPQNLPEDAD